MAGIRVDVVPSRTPVLLAVAFGVVVATAATVRPARRATRTDVAAELSLRERREETGVPRLTARALAALAVGAAAVGVTVLGGSDGALEPWQPAVAWLGLLASLVALAYAMGRIGAVVATVVLRRVDLSLPPLKLAFANLVREPGRTGVMVLAAAAAIGVGYLSDSFTAQARAGILDMAVQNQGDGLSVTVGPSDGSETIASRPSADVVARVGSHPMVAGSRRFGAIVTSADGAPIEIIALDGDLTGPHLYAGEADTERFEGGEALVGAGLARAQGIEAGGTVELPTREGPVEVPVQGIWAEGRSVGRAVTLPFDAVEKLYGPVPVDGLYVTPVDGVSTGELAAALERDIDDPALRVETADQNAARSVGFVEARLTPFKALQVGLTVLAFVAVMSTLLLVGIQRQRELGLLAATGMTPRAVFAMVVAEAGIVGLIATVVSLPLGTLQSTAFQAVMPLILGWENPIRFDLTAWLTYGVLTTVVAVVGAFVPAWVASRIDVVDALAYE
jgi:putative ABC transport system permease protein